MKNLVYTFIAAVSLLSFQFLQAQQKFSYADSWGKAGFTVEKQDNNSIQLVYSVPEFSLQESIINGQKMQSIQLSGVFLPNNAGAPNIPSASRYIGIPQGASAAFEITGMRTEIIEGVEISPAPRIPRETETGLEYPVNHEIYNSNTYYPSQSVALSEPTQIRGLDVVMLGFSPFQYNPVTKQLKVYKDIRIKINFLGGEGTFGDTRLRNRWIDPLLQDLIINPEVLPVVNYNKSTLNTDDVGFEYLIIVPDAPFFSAWADSIKLFRQKQGIITGIKTLSEVGGNNWSIIEDYLDNAYNTWSIPPVACLLIGDYGTDINNTIDAPIWDSYCVSDNIYGDVDGNDMPDIVMARMTAQNEAQLAVMVKKFLDYERTPPTSEDFYDHPISALGWQSDRWFQICSEVIRGFWEHELGKSPVRINAVNWGDPTVDPWSSATNTADVVTYFGPAGLNYIPATPQGIGGFSGGTAGQINDALNDGAFMLQHRDHGLEEGWGEPAYYNADIDNLTNTDLSFIMSINCLTGKYNYGSEVFAEKFHRYTYNDQPAGALGILAASEVSYSFVNDAYIWGVYDNLWPEFMPGYGSTPAERGILPAFGNAAGKYFLQQSNWPYNTSEKEVTYNLFHHHGDAFLTVFSEVPQNLTVVHDATIFTGVTSFNVTANAGSLICLSINGEILGTASGTGAPVSITIPGTQLPPDVIDVVVTLQNYYRYEGIITVIPPAGPYVVKDNFSLNDNTGNNNGIMDYGETIQLNMGVKNVGIVQADAIVVTLSSTDPFITITDNTASYGDIPAGSVVNMNNAYEFTVADNIPDNHVVPFTLTATDGTNIWLSYFSIKGHAPVVSYLSFTINDPLGNNNGKIDPGETVTLNVVAKNSGSAEVYSLTGELLTTDPFITINTNNQAYGDIAASATSSAAFSVTADIATPSGHMADFDVSLMANLGITGGGSFSIVVGQIPILIVDLDPNHNSGTVMNTVIQGLGLSADYQTSFPGDLNLFSSIFVCLGVYSDNAVLNSSQGQSLKNYLDNGGRLYMEGGDTWNYDPQTAVHPYFKITSPQDGSDDLSTLNGQAGTFTEGMSFTYDGDNNYIDRINPSGGTSAFKIFQNSSPSYGTGIAYDGITYKTIGCSHEFGGLTDGTFPSTKAELMFQYLTFLGIIPEGIAADFTVANTTVCAAGQASFSDMSSGNPISWEWSFPGGTPPSSNLQNPVITYVNTGSYDVTLIISDGADSDTLTKTDYIQIINMPGQANAPSGPATLCNNTPFTVLTTLPVSGATTYQWNISPSNAGVISGTTTSATIYWNVTFSGLVSITVTAGNTCGDGPESAPLLITMNPAPIVSLANFSNVCSSWSEFQLSGGLPAGGVYTGNAVTNGYFYPSQALLGFNQITYTVTENGCTSSTSKSIFVDACTDIQPSDSDVMSIEIIPNPVQDQFLLNTLNSGSGMIKTQITNLLGEVMFDNNFISSGKEHKEIIHTASWAKGLYFIRIENDNHILCKKFLKE
ncbi:MAG: C25 family cysteine peptidase [Bacteroidales bacterium]